MRLHWIAPALMLVLALAAAQVLAQGTTVQLPTFAFSNVSTTVMVPDRGSAFLGGINRASSGRNEFGTPMLDKLPFTGRAFKNTGIGQDRSGSSFHVTAYIHDFDAMEEALLGGQYSSFSSTSSSPLRRLNDPPVAIAARAIQPRAGDLAGNWLPKSSEKEEPVPEVEVAQEQARRAALLQTRAAEAQDLFDRGEQAEAAGKANVAKLYYQMAAKRSSGELKQQALARLETLGGGRTTKVAQRDP